jgi:hypothetical protein
MSQGRSMSLFQASQQWSTMSVYEVKIRFERWGNGPGADELRCPGVVLR